MSEAPPSLGRWQNESTSADNPERAVVLGSINPVGDRRAGIGGKLETPDSRRVDRQDLKGKKTERPRARMTAERGTHEGYSRSQVKNSKKEGFEDSIKTQRPIGWGGQCPGGPRVGRVQAKRSTRLRDLVRVRRQSPLDIAPVASESRRTHVSAPLC